MRRVACIAFLCVVVSPLAMAELMVKETGVDPVKTVTVNSYLGYDGGVYAGVYQLQVTGSDPKAPGVSGIVDAFCIDIEDFSPTSPTSYSVISLKDAPDPKSGPMGELRARYLATLLNTYWTDWTPTNNQVLGGLYSDDQAAAALQLAIWEVVDEFNTNGGVETIDPLKWTVTSAYAVSNLPGRQFKATCGDSSVTTLANSMLRQIAGVPVANLSGFGNYAALTDECKQDYVVRVPVPAAALLGMLGLSVAGMRLRKRV